MVTLTNMGNITFSLSSDTVMVMIVDDDVMEDSEELFLSLVPGSFSGDRNIVIIDPDTARLIIDDDDGKLIERD